MMGDKNVLVDEKSNISVGDVKYEYTPGFWELIMMKTPPVESYTNGDLLNYRRLVQQVNLMTYPRNVIQGQSRPKTPYKWRNMLVTLQQQEAGVTNEDADDEQSGEGIQFLPGDIRVANEAEFIISRVRFWQHVVNTERNVYILDELLRRKQISRVEYIDISSYLSKNASSRAPW